LLLAGEYLFLYNPVLFLKINFRGSIMERFLKFNEEIDLKELQDSVSDQGVIVLRKSQTTDTIRARVPQGRENRELKRVFGPYHAQRVYNEFPYPIRTEGLSKYIFWPLDNSINNS